MRCQPARNALLMLAACLALVLASARGAPAQARLQAATATATERHVGSVDDALVGLEVANSAADGSPLPKSHANGFVLRCDGFIVVPRAAFSFASAAPNSAPKLDVVFHPGASEVRSPAVVVPKQWFLVDAGYAVFKAPDAPHAPALRVLLPDMLKAGDPVEVVWRPWDAAHGRFGPLVRRAARLGDTGAAIKAAQPASIRLAAHKATMIVLRSLLPAVNPGAKVEEPTEQKAEQKAAPARDPEGFIRFAEPLPDAPPGAVVIGPAGMAVGTVGGENGPDKGASAGFYSFALLNALTNCVGASPKPNAIDDVEDGPQAAPPAGQSGAPAQGGPARLGEMVRIPGGPVAVPRTLLRDQPDMNGATEACIAPFEIDTYEVTNGEYLAFWNSLPEKERADPNVHRALYPLGWAPEGEPFPPEMADVPVLGVSAEGAEEYARAQGKRLPTPYEWAKAALGPKGLTATPDWVRQYVADRVAAWRQFYAAHVNYLRANPGEFAFDGGPASRNLALQLRVLPWFREAGADRRTLSGAGGRQVQILMPRDHLRFSAQMAYAITDALCAKWLDPLYVVPVGSRPYDISPYGVRDALLNADELYLSNPAPPIGGAMRYVRTEWVRVRDRRLPEADEGPWATRVMLDIGAPPTSHGLPDSRLRLSRLYGRTVRQRGPGEPLTPAPLDVLSHYFSIHDTLAMLYPITGWNIVVEAERTTDVGYPVKDPLVEGGYGYRAFPEWGGAPAHAHRELGRPPAEQGTELYRTRRPEGYSGRHVMDDLHFILPVGFRCAR